MAGEAKPRTKDEEIEALKEKISDLEDEISGLEYEVFELKDERREYAEEVASWLERLISPAATPALPRSASREVYWAVQALRAGDQMP
jgi:hypothetical protein